MPRRPTDATRTSPSEPLPFPAEALLASIEGIAYLVDGAGIILAMSRGPFLPLHEEPLTPWDSRAAIGACLFDIVRGEQLRGAYRTLHRAVWDGNLTTYGFEYRCDAPATERQMRMSLSLIRAHGRPHAVLYHSVVIRETSRVPLPLFAFDIIARDRPRPRKGQLVVLCSYCQRVAWPIDAPDGERDWIEAAEFYRRGGRTDAMVSHGLCEECFQRVVEPTLQEPILLDPALQDPTLREPAPPDVDSGHPPRAARPHRRRR